MWNTRNRCGRSGQEQSGSAAAASRGRRAAESPPSRGEGGVSAQSPARFVCGGARSAWGAGGDAPRALGAAPQAHRAHGGRCPHSGPCSAACWPRGPFPSPPLWWPRLRALASRSAGAPRASLTLGLHRSCRQRPQPASEAGAGATPVPQGQRRDGRRGCRARRWQRWPRPGSAQLHLRHGQVRHAPASWAAAPQTCATRLSGLPRAWAVSAGDRATSRRRKPDGREARRRPAAPKPHGRRERPARAARPPDPRGQTSSAVRRA